MRFAEFSLRGLYEAIDLQRRARGISWAQVADEMNGKRMRPSVHRLSPSTIADLRTRNAVERDDVSQMLRWLKRTPDSFMGGTHSQCDSVELPHAPAEKVLRFDTKKLHTAIDARRIERGLTWNQIATEVGVGVSSLAHLSAGGPNLIPPSNENHALA